MPLEDFVSIWYKRSFHNIASAFSLLSYGESGIPEEISKKCLLLSQERVLGATENLKSLFEADSIISGGPCIDDCHKGISLESFFEISSLIKIGKELNKKVIIHIGIQEEILRCEQTSTSINQWKSIGDKYERLIKTLKSKIGYANVFCCRSDKKEIDEQIKHYAAKLQKMFSLEDAKTLYQHLNSTSKPVQKDSFNFNIHTRFLALYLPEFVEAVLGVKEAKLLVYEDLQQVMAVKKGYAFTILSNHFNNGPCQIITLPFPGIDGLTRMHRFDRSKRPFLHTSKEELEVLCNAMSENVFRFNKNNWPEELGSNSIINRKSLANFFSSLKEYDKQ